MTPPPRGRVDYHGRLARVTAYIHDHLDAPLDLDLLAGLAHLSPYHWHRIYHALQGETVAATVRRLRLQRGSGYLAHTAHSVARIAALCGYPNAQSFARAFRQAYGASPSEWRRAARLCPFEAMPPPGACAEAGGGWPVEVREVPAVALAGIDHRGAYMRIGRAFEAARLHAAAQGLVRQGARSLAVYFDDPFAFPEAQLRSRAGLEVPLTAAVQPPLATFTLGGVPCAVLRYRGPYAGMRAAYQWLFGPWLLASGRVPANHPVFEEYLNDPRDTVPADLLSVIYLPLEPLAG